jgi:hypothetical protein
MMKKFFIRPSIGQRKALVYREMPNSGVRQSLTGERKWIGLAALCVLCGHLASGVTLGDLKADKHLTPERLMKQVAGFRFKLGRTVRKAEDFLRQRGGDCDDFATLAADVLRQKGYTTRLVAVFMAGEVHVVCYVAEVGGYLDYNRRHEPSPVVKCDDSLATIGASVAKSFHSDWVSASEYTFQDGEANFVLTEFH